MVNLINSIIVFVCIFLINVCSLFEFPDIPLSYLDSEQISDSIYVLSYTHDVDYIFFITDSINYCKYFFSCDRNKYEFFDTMNLDNQKKIARAFFRKKDSIYLESAISLNPSKFISNDNDDDKHKILSQKKLNDSLFIEEYSYYSMLSSYILFNNSSKKIKWLTLLEPKYGEKAYFRLQKDSLFINCKNFDKYVFDQNLNKGKGEMKATYVWNTRKISIN